MKRTAVDVVAAFVAKMAQQGQAVPQVAEVEAVMSVETKDAYVTLGTEGKILVYAYYLEALSEMTGFELGNLQGDVDTVYLMQEWAPRMMDDRYEV